MTSCFDLWVYSRHFFQVHRLGKLHMQRTNWKRGTAKSKLAHTIYLCKQTSFTRLGVFVLLFKNRDLNPSKIPSVHRDAEGWTSRTQSKGTKPFRANPQTLWPLAIRPQPSHLMSNESWKSSYLGGKPAAVLPLARVAQNQPRKECCPLCPHPPRTAWESSTSKIILLSSWHIYLCQS